MGIDDVVADLELARDGLQVDGGLGRLLNCCLGNVRLLRS